MKSLKEFLMREVPHIVSDIPKYKTPRFYYRLKKDEEVSASLKYETSHPNKSSRNVPAQNLPEFKVSTRFFVEGVINDILSGKFFHLITESESNRVLVEFSSPNIAKPFHMGHLRSTLLGNFVANILSETRLHVVRVNYLGDWGTQFGLVLAGLGATVDDVSIAIENLEDLGFSFDESSENHHTDTIVRGICDAYVLSNQHESYVKTARDLTAAMEQGKATKAVEIWKAIRRISIEHLKDTYYDLGITFDSYMYESDFSKSAYESTLGLLLKKGIVREENGQMVLCESGLPLGRSDGASLYLGRDIASAIYRIAKYSPTSMVYVIDKSQQNHVSALIDVMSHISNIPVHHVHFGKIHGMSTRSGKGALLSDIMKEAFDVMLEQQEKSQTTKDKRPYTTSVLALSNLCIYLLKQRRTRDFDFCWEAAVLGTGDCGTRLQYCHSRLTSLEQLSGILAANYCHYYILRPDPTSLQLITTLANYEDMVLTCAETMESSYAVKYAFQLCHCINKCLREVKVRGEAPHLAEQRLLLFSSAKLVLAKTMKILGMQPLNHM